MFYLQAHLKYKQSTEMSYSYDSVSSQPLDRIWSAFNTTNIFVFVDVFIAGISFNSTIYSTLLAN